MGPGITPPQIRKRLNPEAGTCGHVCPPLESGEGSPQAKVIFGEFRKISERSGFFAAFPSI